MSIILILMAWFVDMPLWLSITTTTIMSMRIFIKFAKTVFFVADD